MAGVTVNGQIEAKWHGEELKEAVGSAVDLAAVAVQLLIEDLGTDAARQVIRDEIAQYRMDYKGAGVDKRSARKDGE